MNGADRHISDGCFEFDERMSLVMMIDGARFASRTEVGIVADRAFVAITDNISLIALSIAERPITKLSNMTRLLACLELKWLHHLDKPMSRMNVRSTRLTCRTIVPIRAVKAFMTDTDDGLQS